ncbi:unnamed protein product, partial [Medioppia subpectinata]
MKVLLELNGCENYSICINRTDRAVVLPFNQVYNEIRKQIKHNITSNTHVFEIFDMDFNEYCIIPSDEHVIRNLSRLRVRPKTVDNESIGLDINRDSNIGHKYSHKIQDEKNELNLSENYINKSDDSVYNEGRKSWTAGDNTSQNVCINSDMNSGSVPAPEPQSPTPPLLSQCKPLIPILLPVSAQIASPLAPGSHPSAPINYLDVVLNSDTFATTGSSPHMPYITFTARVDTVWVTAIKFVDVEKWAVIRLVQILSNKGAKHPDFIVKQMSKSGFNEWDYDMCMNYFHNALKLYTKCLANCPNRETAAAAYPLFNTMHSFVPHFLMTAKECTKLNDLKRLFAAKCCEWLTTTDPTISAAPVAVIVTDNGSASNGTDIAPVVSETLVTTLTTGSALPALSDTVLVSRTPPMNADHYWPNHSVEVNELDELRSISATITVAHIFSFTYLCHSVGQTVKIVGALTADNEDLFWSHVLQLMLDSGYGSLNKSIYRLLFTHHVTKYYVIALKYLPNYSEA